MRRRAELPLQIWTQEEIRDRKASELRTAIGLVLGQAGIHFPQNEVHLVSVPELLAGRRAPDQTSRSDK